MSRAACDIPLGVTRLFLLAVSLFPFWSVDKIRQVCVSNHGFLNEKGLGQTHNPSFGKSVALINWDYPVVIIVTNMFPLNNLGCICCDNPVVIKASTFVVVFKHYKNL
jgi:hypothetical protein